MPIIQTVNPTDLLAALDSSVDNIYSCPCEWDSMSECECPSDAWKAMLMEEKLDDCAEHFINSVKSEGIHNPICVVIGKRGEWTMGNGHHRLALSINLMLEEIPVVFNDDDGDYMMEHVTDAEWD